MNVKLEVWPLQKHRSSSKQFLLHKRLRLSPSLASFEPMHITSRQKITLELSSLPLFPFIKKIPSSEESKLHPSRAR